MSDSQWPTLTEAAIRGLATSSSYKRGESYYERGAVSDVVQRGETIRADVQGSQYQPYTVAVEFDDTGVTRSACSCPYDHGGICKHRVALLMTSMRDPDRVTEQQPIPELIDAADRETLQNLLVELAESRPEVAEWVETRLEVTDGETDADSSASVNIDSVRRQASNAMPKPRQKGHRDTYAEAERMAEEMGTLIEQARTAIEAGNGDTALDILAAIADEITDHRLDTMLPYDLPSEFDVFSALNRVFSEAILTAELTESERNDWEDRLREWDGELERFTGSSVLITATDAAAQGWDDERVQQAMAGKIDEGEFWQEEKPWYVDDTATARLSVLERQDRTEEYLNLAEAVGKSQAYAEMLIHDGRIEAAVDYTIERASKPRKVLEVAKTLREHDRLQAALRVARHGLALDGHGRDTLATWLRDQAASAGNEDLAIEAAVTAFETSPSLRTYSAVEELADDWEAVRAELLEDLRKQKPHGRTAARSAEVFLHEERYDAAIELADRTGRTSVVEPVVEAVVEERPQWAIDTCKSRAEPIIEKGQYDSYRTAVEWLRQAGVAARSTNELDEWREYVETMRDDHDEKYKLRPMLEDLLEEF